jgi:hypothetical protein
LNIILQVTRQLLAKTFSTSTNLWKGPLGFQVFLKVVTKTTTRIFGLKQFFEGPKLQSLDKPTLFCIWKPTFISVHVPQQNSVFVSIYCHQSLKKKQCCQFLFCGDAQKEFYRAGPNVSAKFFFWRVLSKKKKRFEKRIKNHVNNKTKWMVLWSIRPLQVSLLFLLTKFFSKKVYCCFCKKKTFSQNLKKFCLKLWMFHSKSFGNKLKTLRLQFLIQSLLLRGFSKGKNLVSKNKIFFPVSFLYQRIYFCFSKKKFFFRFLFETFLCLKKTTVNPLRKKNPLYFIQSLQQHPTFSKTTC